MPKEKTGQTYRVADWGLTSYEESYERQRENFERRLEGSDEDTLVVTRHEPTITMGKSASEADLLVPEETLRERGVGLVDIGRGGGITYHGPGQIVLYPIFDLRNYGKDLRDFVGRLGSVMKETVKRFGLNAEFLGDDRIGLWIEGERSKLGSIGLKVKRWYTMHGVALNVDLDEEKASLIRPCGVNDSQLVSITDFLDTELERVKEVLLDEFDREFN